MGHFSPKEKGKCVFLYVVLFTQLLFHCCEHNLRWKHLLLLTFGRLQSVKVGKAVRSSSVDGAESVAGTDWDTVTRNQRA